MNDPKEGFLLNEHLELNTKYVITNDKAFVSCFTFHHDSLNQFRLYGKDSHKEATGVSLIIDHEYFDQTQSVNNIRIVAESDESIKIDILEKEELKVMINDFEQEDISIQKVEEFSESNFMRKLELKLPLYRCIYLDPDSGLIKVAHREEWTFCRKEKRYDSQQWQEYDMKIRDIEQKCRIKLDELKKLINPLYSKIKTDFDELQTQAELLAEILLPLRYLIKHMAFKEEQECRIVYVTQWNDDLIQYDENSKRFYIDYGHDMVQYLKKIYLAPYAAEERNIFEYIAAHAKENKRTENDVKVSLSHNPFRQFS